MVAPAPPDHQPHGVGARVAAAIAAALALLIWTCRRAPLGAPVMDDYMFIYALQFTPFDLFGHVALNPYWRPLSRQVYYLVFGPVMVAHPWVAALVHLLLLAILAVLLYRIARRWLAPGASIVVATFPLLAEPARLILAWPSCAQPLLAMVFATLALHEALAGRRWTAAAAALVGALSYEQALLVFPPVTALAWRRGGRTIRALLPSAAALALFALGEWIARGHGAGLFGPALREPQQAEPASHIRISVEAQLNLLEPPGVARIGLAIGYVALAAIALIMATTRGARARLRRVLPLVGGGGAWFALGVIAIAVGSAVLCAWRSMLPGLGLAFALTAGLAAISPWLPLALVALRVAGLLLSPVVPPGVEGWLPETRMAESFVRIARLQRVVDSARKVIRQSDRSFARGASICYWSRPQMVGAGFARQEAVRVWLGDSTATWTWLDDVERRHDLVLAFNTGVPSPAVVLRPEALECYRLAVAAQRAGDIVREDSLVTAAIALQRPPADAFTDELARVGSRLAFERGDLERADSLNRVSWTLRGESPDFDAMAAMLALRRGQPDRARELAMRCLALAPGNAEAIDVLRQLDAGP